MGILEWIVNYDNELRALFFFTIGMLGIIPILSECGDDRVNRQ